MRAVILAAGRGSRMGSFTDEQPKCFTVLDGRRLLDRQLDALRGAGIDQVAIVRGYLAESFTEPVHYFDNTRWHETNMVRTLQQAEEWLTSDDCIVSYSDIFYGADAVRALLSATEPIALSFDPDWLALWSRRFAAPLSDAETFARDEAGLLTEIGERPNSVDEVGGQFMGLLRFTPTGWSLVADLLRNLGPAADRMDMTGMLRRGLACGWRVQTVPVVGRWGEVDAVTDLDAYEAGA